MIALASFLGFLGLVYLASCVGAYLRRQRKRQYPPLYVVRDEPLDIAAAIKRKEVN